MSVIEKLITIQSCKENIKQAITDKGVDMTNVAFTDYATKISEIQTGGGGGDPEGGSVDYLELRANLRDYQSNVENVPNYAFAYCDSLTSIDLPNCYIVGNNAFLNCENLRSVDSNCSFVQDSAFLNCSSLETVNLPECHAIQDNSTFEGCRMLRTVNIPNLSGTLGTKAFKDCGSLTSIDLPKCDNFGDSVFQNCFSLGTVNLPNMTIVPSYMFDNCNTLGLDMVNGGMTPIELPKVRVINSYAFNMCYSMMEVSAPTLERICSNAFKQCMSLGKLDISGTYWCDLEDINAFEETPLSPDGYGEIHVPNSSLSKYQNDPVWSVLSARFVGVGDADKPLLAFDNGRLYGDTAVLNDNFTTFLGIMKEDVSSIDLPNCSEIGEQAFSMNAQLSSINLPKCEIIGNSAFDMCNLTSIDLPNCLEIGIGGFGNNMQLSSVNLPKCEIIYGFAISGSEALTSVELPNIKFIADYAFAFNMNLKTITIGNTESVCILEALTAFEGTSIETIYVPNNLVGQYKSDIVWGQIAHIIVGI